MQTLWDLIERVAPKLGAGKRRAKVKTVSGRVKPLRLSPPSAARPAMREAGARASMQDRYDAVTRDMLARYGVKVRRWRSSMSGIAWELRYRDGSRKRLIEAPRPKGPMSVAVFLHEIGHHAIGFNTYKPRCLEEYHAWVFALDQMEKLGLNITESVRRRMHDSLHYAVQKARRRGIKQVPAELEPYGRGRWKRP